MRKRLMRAPLLGLAVAAGWLWFGSFAAWGDTTVDTTACPSDGNVTLTSPGSGRGASQDEAGNEFVAPTDYLKTFSAVVAADQNQAVTIGLYSVTGTTPSSSPLWSAPATVMSTGAAYQRQTFTIDQPLSAGNTYALALTGGPPTANLTWALATPSPGACNPGPLVDAYAGQPWFPPLTNSVLLFDADFGTASPPSLNPAPVSFPGQTVGTIGSVETVTVSSTGDVPLTLGTLSVSGADGGDFVTVEDQCSGQTLQPPATCTVGLRFAPQVTGGAMRTATLSVPYLTGTAAPAGAASPPYSVLTDSLSGTVLSAAAGQSAGTPTSVGHGKVEEVTCATVTRIKRLNGRNRRVSQEQCRIKLVPGPLTLKAGGAGQASLSRAGVVYATGVVQGARVVLRARRALTPGSYILTVSAHHTTTRRQAKVL
ncbi:MAG: hypothetical protein JO027_11945 [Solirubrobacterales bacterium]|nr:hypothetical protein [Solirubrobacterales bacterium]